uniref:sigma-70 family RNA polymerase sigma factor n=1 Tax=Allorhizocola rhizosphaerae TaxID=1872709 RepID=UPI000E3D709D
MTKEYEAPDPGEPGDAEAMAAVRSGDTGAFDVLYRRHVHAARRMARVLARDPSDVDDLVAESFARVLAILSSGRGPQSAFRPYLFTTLRNQFYERTRQERRLQVTDDMSRLEAGVPFVDTPVGALELAHEMSLVSKAFASLPERWQTVLWHTEVERERPSKVAPLLGLTPNGVAALAYRAREGLRQQYLQEHIASEPADECRWAIERLGAYVRGGLARRDTAKIHAHLAGCRRCHVLFVELGEVSARMRDLLAPALVASGYFVSAGKVVWLAPVVKVAKRRDTQVVAGVVAVAAGAALALMLTSQPVPPPGGPPPAAAPSP